MVRNVRVGTDFVQRRLGLFRKGSALRAQANGASGASSSSQ